MSTQTTASSSGFRLFDTAIGTCGIAWSAAGVTAVQLPDASSSRARSRLSRQAGAADQSTPPASVAEAIAKITALMAGERRDLRAVALDMRAVAGFAQQVYDVARTIAPGETLTYGEVAARVVERDAREVGRALGANPFPIIVPCHRVVAAGGKAGGFSAPGGVATKLRMLAIEGAGAGGPMTLFDTEPPGGRSQR